MADRVAIMRRGVLQDVGTPTQVYGRPATLYVAAFLGSPRMNLLEASVYVHLDRYVHAQPRRAGAVPAVGRHPGAGGLALPRRADRHRHACRGADPGRAEHPGRRAAAAASGTSSTTGTSRSRSSTSAPRRSWSTTSAGTPTEPVESGRLRKFGHVVQRLAGRGESRSGAAVEPASAARTSVLSDPGRHHRRPAELAVRLAPYPQVSPGHRLSVARTDGRAALLRRARRPDRRGLALNLVRLVTQR